MSTGRWSYDDIPDQNGRIAVVTGADSGIGLQTARALAVKGATVVLACRDTVKAARAAELVGPRAEVVPVDLASLASVRRSAGQVRDRYGRIDLLINNAGVMATPPVRTVDGFELQLAVNHLGHFALTGLLLDLMMPVPGSRVVTVASLAHHWGWIGLDDLNSERSYNRFAAYGRAKLANVLFTYELQRRLSAGGVQTAALAAHPGLVGGTAISRSLPGVIRFLNRTAGPLLFQTAPMGALPTLRAATDPGARGGDYYGPSGPAGVGGHPVRARSSGRSRDAVLQAKVWDESERLTGIRYPL
ncbi:short-chain dehydrogenase [Planobispora rosea]|uniref:Short-chain dehydrogenase n=1 Tax=Planobispora rosea TaxID=35762 RepID=A0A8J3WCV6_PLARO|nr:oxidoreductase [Planobispora rosea]GGS70487.1 short-chain dehydrogenase [Planobispora rosea]GIH83281.1 short-chain dehydrogenase [Planobispora rosea]